MNKNGSRISEGVESITGKIGNLHVVTTFLSEKAPQNVEIYILKVQSHQDKQKGAEAITELMAKSLEPRKQQDKSNTDKAEPRSLIPTHWECRQSIRFH